jgi:hypothetical protein
MMVWSLFFVTVSSSMLSLGVVVQRLGRKKETRIGTVLRVLYCLTPTILPTTQYIDDPQV